MRSAYLLVFAAALASCSSRTDQISVEVLTESCTYADGTVSPTAGTKGGVDHWQITISGPGIGTPIVTSFAVKAGATIPQIPPGAARVMSIVGFQGDPAGTSAVFLSSGTSAPFTVPATPGGTPTKVTVVLRAGGVFSGANQAANIGQCAHLINARAGHTATLLNDGRVLIAGGFSVAPTVQIGGAADEFNWVFHPDTEIFDPRTGSVISAAPMVYPLAPFATTWRAFHTANLLPSTGQVIVIGGEVVPPVVAPDGGGTLLDGGLDFSTPSGTEGIENQMTTGAYDPSLDSWIFLFGQPAYAARSRHTSMFDPQSNAILSVGGVTFSGARLLPAGPNGVASTPAWFAPVSQPCTSNAQCPSFSCSGSATVAGTCQAFSPVYLAGGADGGPQFVAGSAAPISASLGGQGSAMAEWLGVFVVANGLTATQTLPSGQPTVGFIEWMPSAVPAGGAYELLNESDATYNQKLVGLTPRAETAMAAMTQSQPSDTLLIAGGFATGDAGAAALNDINYLNLQAGTTFPEIETATSLPAASARGDICAAALADGRALTTGGDNGTWNGVTSLTSASTELWSFNASGQPVSTTQQMFYDRKWHTCTLLQDGSVVVIGGVSTAVQNNGFKVLDSIEIFTPVPLASPSGS